MKMTRIPGMILPHQGIINFPAHRSFAEKQSKNGGPKNKNQSTANYEGRKLGAETQLGDETNSVGVVKEHEDFLTTPQGDAKYMIKGQKAFHA